MESTFTRVRHNYPNIFQLSVYTILTLVDFQTAKVLTELITAAEVPFVMDVLEFTVIDSTRYSYIILAAIDCDASIRFNTDVLQ